MNTFFFFTQFRDTGLKQNWNLQPTFLDSFIHFLNVYKLKFKSVVKDFLLECIVKCVCEE